VLILLLKPHTNIIFSAYIPLLLGFFSFIKHCIFNLRDEDKKLISIILICEMTLIYLKTGRSFHESLRQSLNKVDAKTFKFCEKKKNVVMQQPKSSKSQLFVVFQQDLARVSNIDVGKQELLKSTRDKYSSLLSLKQKLKTATTQYRAQSFTLIFLWCGAVLLLTWQGKVLLYKGAVFISFLMMALGLALSKKILVKDEFRI